MTYVITFGPLNDEREVCCETATEALSLLLGLQEGGEDAIVVASYETAAEATKTLHVLATHERLMKDVAGDTA